MEILKLKQTHTYFQTILKSIAISLMLAISAQINVIMYPVPITLQSLVVLFIGLICSPATALLSVGMYLAEIAAGLPFASGFSGGFATLFSLRAGYFLGFLLSVYASSTLLSYSRNFAMMWVAAVLNMVVLYTTGTLWLAMFLGVEKALAVGLYPFLSEIPAFITLSVIVSHQLSLKLKHKF